MKKFLFMVTIFILFLSSTLNAQGRFSVKVRPVLVVKSRPSMPRATMIWIEPEWIWRNGNYIQVDGYWTEPRRGFVYVPGHWKRYKHGFYWVSGSWIR